MFAAALLALAISVEVAATACLKRTAGFTNIWWTIAVVFGYALAIWLLTRVVRELPVSVTYATWAGAGTAAIAVIGGLFLHERLSMLNTVGLALIVCGVALVNIR
ncbi:DMT family transporter [uncultured Jatrophihabitans sp.]|uniref:DMT family transporter n=1 Tax=uncultured Jatrophihabitans sp. TaxID=1610747 RepID=UPI0035CBD0C2